MNFKEGAFTQAKLVKINPAAEEFYYLLRNELSGQPLPWTRRTQWFGWVAQFIDQALLAVDYRKPGSRALYASVVQALEKLKKDSVQHPAI